MAGYTIFASIGLLLVLIHVSTQDTVSTSAACQKVGTYYAQGCSGLTSELLGRPWKAANQYRRGASVGSNNQYSNVSPGELVGFPGHVAIYVGNSGCDCKFVDVPGPNKNARCVRSGYGPQTVYKYNY